MYTRWCPNVFSQLDMSLTFPPGFWQAARYHSASLIPAIPSPPGISWFITPSNYRYIYIYIYIIYIYLHLHVSSYIYIYLYTTYIYMYLHISTYTYVCLHIYLYIYIYRHISTYIYVYLHISTINHSEPLDVHQLS